MKKIKDDTLEGKHAEDKRQLAKIHQSELKDSEKQFKESSKKEMKKFKEVLKLQFELHQQQAKRFKQQVIESFFFRLLSQSSIRAKRKRQKTKLNWKQVTVINAKLKKNNDS